MDDKDKLGKLKLRICLDPTNLNKAIVHKPYHFKIPEDIALLLADACFITVSDCRKGFWHQLLDEASSFLTMFNTELGRFCYTVMPFGTTAPGDVFQCKLNECFGKIEQEIIIADDIMIVMCNVKLNYDKLQYKQDEVEFFGKTYTTNGCKPGKDKVAAITSMPSLTNKNNKKQVQSYIGMINYLSKFSPRLSELAEPTRELSKDKVPFNWGPEHQQAFVQMKKEIANAPVLTYYNPKKRTTLQTDSSVKGHRGAWAVHAGPSCACCTQ